VAASKELEFARLQFHYDWCCHSCFLRMRPRLLRKSFSDQKKLASIAVSKHPVQPRLSSSDMECVGLSGPHFALAIPRATRKTHAIAAEAAFECPANPFGRRQR